MFTPLAPFSSPKSVLREKLKAERRHAHAAQPDAAKHAARNFLDNIPVTEGMTISLYKPMREELDTAPLADSLHERGTPLCLPVVARRNAPLIFRRYLPGDALVAGSYDTVHPTDEADELSPDIIVTPLLGFSRNGARLGYGGGYYDRTLEQLRANKSIIAVGYAYGAQQVDRLPTTDLDQPLDWVVTERGAIRTDAGREGAA